MSCSFNSLVGIGDIMRSRKSKVMAAVVAIAANRKVYQVNSPRAKTTFGRLWAQSMLLIETRVFAIHGLVT